MNSFRTYINLMLCPVAVLSFLIAATDYVPPLSDSFKLFLNCAFILSIALSVAVLIFGLIDIFKYKRRVALNCICICIVATPWIIVLRLLVK